MNAHDPRKKQSAKVEHSRMITASDNKENKPIVNEHTDPGDPMSPEANDFDCIESHNSEEHEKIIHELLFC